MKLPEFDNELQTIETEGGTLAYTGVGQVSFFKLPKFDTTPIRYTIDVEDSNGNPVTLQILSGSAPGSVPVVDSTPVLHDRLYPVQWVPGFNQDSEQARGLVAAFPLWDRSGIAQDVVGKQDFQLDAHSWRPDEKLGDVLYLGIDHTKSTGGSPQQLRESDGFSVSCWLKRQASGIVLGRLDSDDPDLWRWNLHYSASAVSLRFYTGSFVTLSTDVFTEDGWNHLVVSLRKLDTDSYTGEVFVNGIYVDSFDEAEIVSSEMNTTGNLVLGSPGTSNEVGSRLVPFDDASFTTGWQMSDSGETLWNLLTDDPSDIEAGESSNVSWTYDPLEDHTPQINLHIAAPETFPTQLTLRVSCGTTTVPTTTIHLRDVAVLTYTPETVASYGGYDYLIPNGPTTIEIPLELFPPSSWDEEGLELSLTFEFQGSDEKSLLVYDVDLFDGNRRFTTQSVGAYGGDWEDENESAPPNPLSVVSDPEAYTDETYWRVAAFVPDTTYPQIVSNMTGTIDQPSRLRLRIVADSSGVGGTTCKLVQVSINNYNPTNLAQWTGSQTISDTPTLYELDLDVDDSEEYGGYDWQVSMMFELAGPSGSGTRTLTVYDFDVIELQALGYFGSLKDLRLYNRPLHASEVFQIHNFAEALYEQPTAYRLVCGRFLEASATIEETTIVDTTAVATREVTVEITPAASVATTANAHYVYSSAITATTAVNAVGSGTLRASASITPAASVSITAVKLGGTAVAITPAASVAAAAIKEAVATVAITPTTSVAANLTENAGKEISSSVASTSLVSVSAGFVQEAEIEITPAASIAVQAKPVRRIAAAITPAASVSVAASIDAGLRSSITPATSVSTAANKEAAATVAITPAASVSVVAAENSGIEISCSIALITAVAVNAGQEREAEIAITPAASVATAARRNRFAAVSVNPAANMAVNASYAAAAAQIGITPAASVSAAAVRDRAVASSITELTSVNALGILSPKYSAESTIRETSNVTAAATVIRGATAVITPRATVTTTANYTVTVTVGIQETSKVKAEAEWLNQNLMNDLATWLEPQLSVYLYPVTLPMQVELPAITYARQSTDYSYFLDGKLSPQVATTMSFDVFATSYDQAEQLGQEIVDALHGYTGYIGRTRVLSSEVSNVSDSSWYQSGLSCEGIIRSIDVEISHKINTSLTGYDAQDEATLAETLANIVANVSYQPDIVDTRPIVKLERTGNELMQYLGQEAHDPDSVGYQITVSGTKYADCLALATTIRQNLGIAVEDEYDSYDYDAQNTPLYEVVLEVSA